MTDTLTTLTTIPPRTQPQGTIGVCVDCMLTHANGEATESPDREPWALWANEPAGSITGPDDVESYFSWSDCDGCGSKLGGDRWTFTYWF